MQEDIFIVGTGQTPFGEHWDKSLKDLMEEAVTSAILNSDLTALDIDFIVVSNMLGERTNDQAHLGAMASALLPHRPPALRTEAACASGSVAVHTAISLLESGRAENILVIGVEKMTDVSSEEISLSLMGAADAEKDIPTGLTFPGIFGLIANRYMHEYGLTREKLNKVSAKHHENAAKNPNAQFRNAIPEEKISQSPSIADPLCLLDCSPISDGASAIILSSSNESQIRIKASQVSTDTLSIAERPSITSFPATRDAMDRALDEAEITRDDIAHLETHDCFSIAAVINLEDLGFAAPGRGIRLYESDSKLTVNASGGLKACGHPVGATGIKQIVDLIKQLKSSNEKYALAHNFGGAGATCCIHILERAS